MERLQNVMLYVASHSMDDPYFGAIKLNKILFSIDFFAYGLWGERITEIDYIRQEHGPTPEPSAFLATRDDLIETGKAVIQEKTHFGKVQKRLIALVEPNMSLFTERERALIDNVIEEFRRYNATELSEWTHTLIPWLEAEDREPLPLNTIFTFRRRPVGRAGLTWGEERLQAMQDAGELP